MLTIIMVAIHLPQQPRTFHMKREGARSQNRPQRRLVLHESTGGREAMKKPIAQLLLPHPARAIPPTKAKFLPPPLVTSNRMQATPPILGRSTLRDHRDPTILVQHKTPPAPEEGPLHRRNRISLINTLRGKAIAAKISIPPASLLVGRELAITKAVLQKSTSLPCNNSTHPKPITARKDLPPSLLRAITQAQTASPIRPLNHSEITSQTSKPVQLAVINFSNENRPIKAPRGPGRRLPFIILLCPSKGIVPFRPNILLCRSIRTPGILLMQMTASSSMKVLFLPLAQVYLPQHLHPVPHPPETRLLHMARLAHG